MMTISKLTGSFSLGPPPPGVLQAMQRVQTPLNERVYLEVKSSSPASPSEMPPTCHQLTLLLLLHVQQSMSK